MNFMPLNLRCFMPCGIFAANHWLLKTVGQLTEREECTLTYSRNLKDLHEWKTVEVFLLVLASFANGFSEMIVHFRLTQQRFRH